MSDPTRRRLDLLGLVRQADRLLPGASQAAAAPASAADTTIESRRPTAGRMRLVAPTATRCDEAGHDQRGSRHDEEVHLVRTVRAGGAGGGPRADAAPGPHRRGSRLGRGSAGLRLGEPLPTSTASTDRPPRRRRPGRAPRRPRRAPRRSPRPARAPAWARGAKVAGGSGAGVVGRLAGSAIHDPVQGSSASGAIGSGRTAGAGRVGRGAGPSGHGESGRGASGAGASTGVEPNSSGVGAGVWAPGCRSRLPARPRRPGPCRAGLRVGADEARERRRRRRGGLVRRGGRSSGRRARRERPRPPSARSGRSARSRAGPALARAAGSRAAGAGTAGASTIASLGLRPRWWPLPLRRRPRRRGRAGGRRGGAAGERPARRRAGAAATAGASIDGGLLEPGLLLLGRLGHDRRAGGHGGRSGRARARAGVATWSAPRERVRRASTYEAPPSEPPMSEEPMMSSHAPPDVAPPRPVAGAVVGSGGAVVREDDLGGHARAADDEAAGGGAGNGAHLRLDEGAALAAGTRDGHGVAAGGHGEVAGGVAESDTGTRRPCRPRGRRPCRPRTPRGPRGGWPCRARRRRPGTRAGRRRCRRPRRPRCACPGRGGRPRWRSAKTGRSG